MDFPIIALRANKRQFTKLANLGVRRIDFMTLNANFTTPVPALATLQTAVDEMQAAITVWGNLGNRGSYAD